MDDKLAKQIWDWTENEREEHLFMKPWLERMNEENMFYETLAGRRMNERNFFCETLAGCPLLLLILYT